MKNRFLSLALGACLAAQARASDGSAVSPNHECRDLFILSSVQKQSVDQVEAWIRSNSFSISRGLADYARELGFDFLNSLASQAEGFTWLDSGAGRALAQREFLKSSHHRSLELLALSARRPWFVPKHLETSSQKSFTYLSDIHLDNDKVESLEAILQGRMDLITDVYGPLSYSKRPDKIINLYLSWLKPGGELRVKMVPWASGTIDCRDGQVRSFQEWLRRELRFARGVTFFESHGSWMIRKISSDVRIKAPLILTRMVADKPPLRRFKETGMD